MTKEKLNVGYITTVSGRWPRELPNERRPKYEKWLKERYKAYNFVCLDRVVEDSASLELACDKFASEKVDIIIFLYGAFSGDDFACGLWDSLHKPIIFWALQEPLVHGTRLLANALVAATMNSASVKRLGGTTYFLFGNEDEEPVYTKLDSLLSAYSLKKQMAGVNFGLFGYRPTAFYNSAFDEGLIRRTFGIKMEETELKVIFDRMAQYSDAEVKEEISRITTPVVDMPPGHLENHARLYMALKEVYDEAGYDYATIKCWPEMGDEKNRAVPCAVLGRLADDGRYIGCEGDVEAALAYAAENLLTGLPCFVSDLININEKENYLTFWHCGNASPSLMDKAQYSPCLSDHPLKNNGTAFRCVLKKGDVTFARFCDIGGKFVLFVGSGIAVDTDLYTPGCMVNVKMEKSVRSIIETAVERGVAHHYALVWSSVKDKLISYAKLLGLEVIEV